MDYSFIFEGKTYYLTIKDNRAFYRDESSILDNKQTCELENKMFNSFIKTHSKKLDDAIDNNPNLTSQKEVFRNFLKYIELYVPLNKREEFYEKTKTLKYKNSIQVESLPGDLWLAGYYTFEINTITINEEVIKKANQVSFSYGNAIYLTIIFHELIHFASSFYYKEKDELFNGFNYYKGKDIIRANNGLTEGVTEYITFLKFYYDSSCDKELQSQAIYRFLQNSYFFNSLLIVQLCIITSFNIVLASHFQNLGIIPLCKKLSEIDHDINNAFKLFAIIDIDFKNRSIKGFNNIDDMLGIIQMQMINYFKETIKMDIMNNKREEEIRQRINLFENHLISEKILKYKNLNINDYPEIVKSVEAFQDLKNKINKYYQTYYQNITL